MGNHNPLHQKLMLDKFPHKLMLHKPNDFHDLDGVPFDASPERACYDLVIAFVLDLDEMATAIMSAAEQDLIADGGYLYLAYPKKGNKIYQTHIDRDSIFPRFGIAEDDGFVPGTPLKFSKMVSLNDTFTIVGLKCFHQKPSQKANTSVDDYIHMLPALRSQWEHRPEVLALYNGLTYGYQKDWARYVYSAKSQETQEKRLLEMADILLAGYKTKNLYRQAQK